jgi:aminoglycoside phosphotransferase (APT) family kinase protein
LRWQNRLQPRVQTHDARGVQMHPGQLTVSADVVRELVREQFPQWRSLPVAAVASHGTVSALFRIGEEFVARFPLLPGDVGATRQRLESEAEAARELAGRTRFPTPETVALGEPGAGYPLPWSVQTWLPGTTAADEGADDSVAFACDLAEFIQGVRAIDTRGRQFSGQGRGGDLRLHDAWMETCFERSEHLLDVPVLRRMWGALRELPRTAGDIMTHGDLIPGNVLVSDGRLAGVIDVGGLGPADPAVDLVAAWHLLDADPREVLRHALECDDLAWQFRWYKGRRHYSGWYWCGTGQRLVLRRGLSSSRTADSSVTLQRAERWRPRQSVQDPAP